MFNHFVESPSALNPLSMLNQHISQLDVCDAGNGSNAVHYESLVDLPEEFALKGNGTKRKSNSGNGGGIHEATIWYPDTSTRLRQLKDTRLKTAAHLSESALTIMSGFS